MIERLRRLGGLDFHTFTTLLLRFWQIVAGGVMILFVPVWLTKVAQGYYYTFSSLVAMAALFELGFQVVVTQIVGHEKAHLSFSPDGTLSGDDRHLDRLTSLLRLLRRWYRVAAILFFVVVGTTGLLFFSRRGALPARDWAGPWLLLVAMASALLYLSPVLAFVEGLGRVGHVARVRAIASVIGYAVMWGALTAGASLWSVWIVPATTVIAAVHWLRHHDRSLRGLDLRAPGPAAAAISWREEILPMQWRIAVTWACSYVTLFLFTPAIFAEQGAVEAGRVGIAFSIFNAIQTMGMSWLHARTPVFTTLVAAGRRAELNRAFRAATVRSTAFVLAACLAVLAGAWALGALHSPIAARIADLPVLACIAGVTVVNTLVMAMQNYMRAHKQEPVLAVSVAGALLTGAVILFATPRGVLPTMVLYLLVTVGVVLTWTGLVFRRYYR